MPPTTQTVLHDPDAVMDMIGSGMRLVVETPTPGNNAVFTPFLTEGLVTLLRPDAHRPRQHVSVEAANAVLRSNRMVEMTEEEVKVQCGYPRGNRKFYRMVK